MSKNNTFHERTKHVARKYHFIRDIIEDGEVEVSKIHTSRNPADILTKSVPVNKFVAALDLLKLTTTEMKSHHCRRLSPKFVWYIEKKMKLESRWRMLKLKLLCDSISEMFRFEADLWFELRRWLSSVQLKLVTAEIKPELGKEGKEKSEASGRDREFTVT